MSITSKKVLDRLLQRLNSHTSFLTACLGLGENEDWGEASLWPAEKGVICPNLAKTLKKQILSNMQWLNVQNAAWKSLATETEQMAKIQSRTQRGKYERDQDLSFLPSPWVLSSRQNFMYTQWLHGNAHPGPARNNQRNSLWGMETKFAPQLSYSVALKFQQVFLHHSWTVFKKYLVCVFPYWAFLTFL